MEERSARTAKIDLQLSPESTLKLPTTASASQQSVSEFVLESAFVRADESLADWTRFGLDVDRWKAFLAALDISTRDLPRLKRLFEEPSVFDTGATS